MDNYIKSLVHKYDDDTKSNYKVPVALVGDYSSPFITALRNKAKRLGVPVLSYTSYTPCMFNIIDVETAHVPYTMRPADDVDHIRSNGMSAVARAIYEVLLKDGVSGKHIVIVGRGHAVKGLATRLLADDASVTICHSKTKYLYDSTTPGEILIVATHPDARPEVCIYNKSIIIDVGNALSDTLAARCENYIDGYKLGPLTTSILLNRCVDHDDD